MNKFQREIIKRRKRALSIIGLGDITYRTFMTWIRKKLKQDIKNGKISL